jgi:hypothetical protein
MKLDATKVKLIVGLVTVFIPYAAIPFSVRNGQMTVSIHALVWGIMPEGIYFSSWINLYYILLGRGLVYGIFNIWFGIEVIRYIQNKDSKNAVFLSGLLTILYPLLWIYYSYPWLQNAVSFVYAGPIPIQLVAGYLLMRYGREPEIAAPWDDTETEETQLQS